MATAVAAFPKSLNVVNWTKEQKIEYALKRGLIYCPSEIAARLGSFFTYANFTVIVATLLAWALAHVYGVGEAVDFVLLIVGTAFVGWGFWKGLRDLVDFAVKAIQARTEPDLDAASKLFASAVVELGVDTVMALLLKKPLTGAAGKTGRITQMKLRPNLIKNPGSPPLGPRSVTTVYNLPANVGGETDVYGNIKLNGNWLKSTLQEVLDHEKGHAFLSPKVALLRQFRADLLSSAYSRSVFLRYLEEAIVESRAQVLKYWRGQRPGGLSDAMAAGFKFPLNGSYRVLVTDPAVDAHHLVGGNIAGQSQMIGVIIVNGHLMHVKVIQEIASHEEQSPKK